MMNEMYKCGYCGFLLHSECEELLDHECLAAIYIEGQHDLVEDQNKVLTIADKTTQETVGACQQDTEEPVAAPALLNFDEQLIKYVQDRPALYNFGLPLSERTNAKKNSLWRQIFNLFGGKFSIEDLQKKWKYLRDSYVRAKKKMTQYKPSGSQASGGPPDPGFRFYETMQFIDDGATYQTTVSSLPHQPCSEEPSTSGVGQQHHFMEERSRPLTSANRPSTSASRPSTSTSRASSDVSIQSPLPSPDILSPQAKRKRKDSEMEAKILAALTSPPPRLDGVDGFLLRLGESLRRLPYRERCQIELRIMEMVFEAENRLNID